MFASFARNRFRSSPGDSPRASLDGSLDGYRDRSMDRFEDGYAKRSLASPEIPDLHSRHLELESRRLALEEARLKFEEHKFNWDVKMFTMSQARSASLPGNSGEAETVAKTSATTRPTSVGTSASIASSAPAVSIAPAAEKSSTGGTALSRTTTVRRVGTTHEGERRQGHVFISYCWKNSKKQMMAERKPAKVVEDAGICDPREIKDLLANAGHDVWLDTERLGDGHPLYADLVNALDHASVVVAFISDQYTTSENCKKEFFYAKGTAKLPIIPVIVGKPNLDGVDGWKRSEIGFELGSTLYIDARSPETVDAARQRLLKAVADKLPKTAAQVDTTDIFTAAAMEGDDEELCRKILDAGADIKQRDEDGKTLLHAAAGAGNESVVRLLLERGCNVHLTDNALQTPLHHAARADVDSTAVVEQLVEAGADIEAKTEHSETTVLCAMGAGNVAITNYLLVQGADPNVSDSDNMSLFHHACNCGALDVVINLLRRGNVDFSLRSSADYRPLDLFCVDGNTNGVWLLLNAGAPIECEEGTVCWSALSHAAGKGSVDTVRLLLDKGAQLRRDPAQTQPIHAAATCGSVDCLGVLLEAGADIEEVDEDGWTALHYAARNGQAEAVQALLEHGANVNCTTTLGHRVMHFAVLCDNVGVLTSLLDHGADIEQLTQIDADTEEMGYYAPLQFAAYCGSLEAVNLLLDRGAAVEGVHDELVESPLFAALRGQEIDTARALLTKGADMYRQVNNRRTTPLNIAAKGCRLDIMKLLVEEFNADVNRPDRRGTVPLVCAMEGIDDTDDDTDDIAQLCTYLLEKGARVDVIDVKNGRNLLHMAAVIDLPKVFEALLARGLDYNAVDRLGLRPLDYTDPQPWDKSEDGAEQEPRKAIKKMLEDRGALRGTRVIPERGNGPIPSGWYEETWTTASDNGVVNALVTFKDDGTVSGFGDEREGSNAIEGTYSPETKEIKFTKYFCAQTYFYTGTYIEEEGKFSGNFTSCYGIQPAAQTFEWRFKSQ
ncbi:hypothetical protein HK104_006161 [Borealophlyctis nickersoniae]|nr:hypothetical protein HK104_006161 [Borealophlyctis nickersoniae]